MISTSPSSARLLRPATIRALLRAALRARPRLVEAIQEAWVERCWPGKRGAVAFEWGFQVRGRVERLYGSFDLNDESSEPEMSPPRPRYQRGSIEGIRARLAQWGVRVFSPDCDESLPHVTSCLEPSLVCEQLRAALGRNSVAGPGLSAQLLAYKPGRRATIAYASRSTARRRAAPRFVGKTFADARGNELIARHRIAGEQLRARLRQHVVVPEPVAFLAPLKMAIFLWSPASAAATARLELGQFAQSLHAVHQLEMPELPVFDRKDESAVVRKWCNHLRNLSPADAAHAERAADALDGSASAFDDSTQRVIHRDFYDRQLVTDGKRLTVLDLDTLAKGPPELDIGNLIAHRVFGALVSGQRMKPVSAITSTIDAYQAIAGRVDARAVHWFASSSLIRVGAVHSLRTRTRRFARPLWRHAARLLAALRTST